MFRNSHRQVQHLDQLKGIQDGNKESSGSTEAEQRQNSLVDLDWFDIGTRWADADIEADEIKLTWDYGQLSPLGLRLAEALQT